MAEKKDVVDRATIAPQVMGELCTYLEVDNVNESDRLLGKLGMGPTARDAMSLPYTRISAQYKGLRVTLDDARKQTTVESSINLVHNRSNGRK